MKKNKRGNITLMLVFVMTATILLLLTAVIAPFGAQITTEMYAAGEDILNETNNGDLNEINDAGVRAELNETFNEAMSNTQANIELYTAVYKYGGWIVIFLVAIVIFLFSRRLAELGYSGGFI